MGEFEDSRTDEGEVVVDQGDDDDEEQDQDAMMQEDDQEEEVRVLVADNSAYEMLHQMQVEWPCLSFDILRDQLGNGRKQFPMTSYIVAGSQAEKAKDNKLYVMKMSELHRTKHDNDDDMDEDSGDEDLDEDPILEFKTVPHNGGVNRFGKVHIWDLTSVVASLDTPGLTANVSKPLFSVDRHNKTEGYAMDWSSLNNKLLSGDIRGKIFMSQLHSNTSFQTDPQAFTGHESSVEDIQWSPAEESVFASCSSDGTIRVWDVRTRNKAQLSWKAHTTDVNVITWNKLTDRLIASGSDSGEFSVWDFRTVASNIHTKTAITPAASFKWHNEAITSIEWHPAESSVLAVSGADDQVTLWDLALERDAEEEPMVASMKAGVKVEVPPQLLFIHQGQECVKEIHWHPQAPGVLISTALSGFNVFKTINS
ncbi:WD40-repeat-containing domain protein [Obelidium mucronatum]|nr:WD40-repeat-containing domain protein [Obelidium mucronatum]